MVFQEIEDHSVQSNVKILFILLLRQIVQMVVLLLLVSLSTDDEDLYIQQAVVFIEDAIQVSTITCQTYFRFVIREFKLKFKSITQNTI